MSEIMATEAFNFKGRIRAKQSQPNMLQIVELPHSRRAFVYKRFSSHEQVKKSIYSIAMQDALEDLARDDGYGMALTKEEIEAIKNAADYPGWYVNGQIVVEERDLGISGTLGKDKRNGLGHLVSRMEKDETESIYLVHISRLFRDQTLSDGLTFGEL